MSSGGQSQQPQLRTTMVEETLQTLGIGISAVGEANLRMHLRMQITVSFATWVASGMNKQLIILSIPRSINSRLGTVK